MTPTLEGAFSPIVPDRFGVSESPLWDTRNNRLLWASINDGEIHAFEPATGARQRWHFPSTVGSLGLTRSGGLVVALRDSVVLFDPQSGKCRTIAEIEMPIEQCRLNDGKVGPDGAFWIGSMDTRPRFEKEPVGKLYRVTAEGGAMLVAENFLTVNGIDFSPAGERMYLADTMNYLIDVWDFDVTTGRVSNRRRFVDCSDETGRPDGAAVDEDGNYWSARPAAAQILCHAPSGEVLRTVAVPNYRPTMPCFGGPGRQTLYVTSLSAGLDAAEMEAHPLAGTVIAAPVGATGCSPNLMDA